MHKTYHIKITRQAIGKSFSPHALETITRANLGQDDLAGQIGRPEFHFDDNKIDAGEAYIAEQRALVMRVLGRDENEDTSITPAWQAFGRLIHAAQDFYAHSNYVRLWVEHDHQMNGAGQSSKADQIDPLDADIITSPNLISGRIYFPWEILSFVPGLEPVMRRLLPADSHTRMNLDSPKQGPLFEYALAAAIKRTIYETEFTCQEITRGLSTQALARFTGRLASIGPTAQ